MIVSKNYIISEYMDGSRLNIVSNIYIISKCIDGLRQYYLNTI